MRHLLIIGGTGFFGKSFLDAYRRGLLRRFQIVKITIMSRNPRRLLIEAPELVGESISLLESDIATCTSLPHADYVIHAAASTDERDYLRDPEREKRNIQDGINNFCRLAEKYCKQAKIVFISSGAVYGGQPENILEVPEDYCGGLVDDLSVQKRAYALAKRNAETAVRELGVRGHNVLIARCFSFVGPYLPLDQHFAIGNFIGNAIRNEPILVKSKNLVYRSYMFSDDLVEWLLTLAEIASTECPVVNVGSNQAIEVGELASLVAKMFNLEVLCRGNIGSSVDRYVPSINKAQFLGCRLTNSNEMAIDNTLRLKMCK